MAGHHQVSRLYQSLAPGDGGPERVSVRNDPPVPDFEGREDVPAWAVPDRSDKEIYKIAIKVAAVPTAETSWTPAIAVADLVDDLQARPGIAGPGSVSNTVGSGVYEIGGYIEWWPDIDITADVDLDRAVFDFEDDPIQWEDGDSLHMASKWHSGTGDHGGLEVSTRLYWRHR